MFVGHNLPPHPAFEPPPPGIYEPPPGIYILRVRVADLADQDFVELELPLTQLNYFDLVDRCCVELGLDKSDVHQMRKMPDIRLRSDSDVRRFNKLEYIEVVVAVYRTQLNKE